MVQAQAAMLFARFAVIQLFISLCVVVTVGGFSSGPTSIVDARNAPVGALRNITHGELVCTHLAPGYFADLSQPQDGNGGYIVNATELIDVLGGSYAPGKRYRGQSYIFFIKCLQMYCMQRWYMIKTLCDIFFFNTIIVIAERWPTRLLIGYNLADLSFSTFSQ